MQKESFVNALSCGPVSVWRMRFYREIEVSTPWRELRLERWSAPGSSPDSWGWATPFDLTNTRNSPQFSSAMLQHSCCLHDRQKKTATKNQINFWIDKLIESYMYVPCSLILYACIPLLSKLSSKQQSLRARNQKCQTISRSSRTIISHCRCAR